MENPFKFEDKKNTRVVTNMPLNWNNIYGGSAFLWACSVSMYTKHIFRVNNNAVYLLTFAAFSMPASYGYAKFMMSTPMEEAAYENNQEEGV